MKIPPYGKHVKEHLANSESPHHLIILFIGIEAWRTAKLFSRPTNTLVLEPWLCPSLYSWPVHGCAVMIRDTSYCVATPYYISDIAKTLYQHGATTVSYHSHTSNNLMENKHAHG
jgi:hypothetical protein